MKKKGYQPEAKYLQTVRNWRQAVDERGPPDATRQKFSMELLDFIVKDLIPWCSDGNRDYRLLEVNR